MLDAGIPLTVVGVLVFLTDDIGLQVHEYSSGSVGAVGVYAMAYSLTACLRMLVEPTGIIAPPILGRNASEGGYKAVMTAAGEIRHNLGGLHAVTYSFTVLSSEFVIMFYPVEFLSGHLPMTIIALSIPAFGVHSFSNKVVIASNVSRYVALVLGIAIPIDVLLTPVLVLPFGIIGASISGVATFLSMGVLSYLFYHGKHEYGIVYWNKIVISAVALVVGCYWIKAISPPIASISRY